MEATFPYLAKWRSVRFWPEGMALEEQRSLNGTGTAIPTMAGRWMATLDMLIHGEPRVLQWQAFLAQMEGRLGTTLVPCFSWFRPLDRIGRVTPFSRTAGLRDAQTWEHFGFDAAPITRITTAAAAPLRAAQLDLTLHDTTGIRPGQYFSIGERLHQVQAHWQPDATTHRIRFHPPLRAAVEAGAHVEVDRPVCKMRFTTETEGQFAQDYTNIAPTITVNFTEAQ